MSPRRCSATAETQITNKEIVTYYKLTINSVDCTSNCLSYSYSVDNKFGSVSLQCDLSNYNKQYSTIAKGQTVVLEEGIYDSTGAIQKFTKFTGTVYQTNPSYASDKNILKLTCLDNLSKLNNLDIDKTYEGSITGTVTSNDGVSEIVAMPNTITGGVKLEETPIASYATVAVSGTVTSITVNDATGFEVGTACLGNIAFDETNAITSTTFEITNVNTTTNVLTIRAKTLTISVNDKIRQLYSQMTSKTNFAQYFDFGYWTAAQGTCTWSRKFTIVATDPATTYWWNPVVYISPTRLPMINIRIIGNTLQDPKWEGYNVGYEVGQLQISGMINVASYEIYSHFWYYIESKMQYVEDIIQEILTLADGYGNVPFSLANELQTTKLIEEGTNSETLIPNTSTVTIEGVEYAANKIRYHKFSNLVTNLSVDSYDNDTGQTIIAYPRDTASVSAPDAELNKVCKRYGFIILENAAAGNVTFDASYTFKTLQSSGVRIPIISFRSTEVENRADAIQQLIKLVAPNYVINYSGDGKVWTKYLKQKTTADYTLKLMTQLDTSQDPEVYTRVKFFGESAMPKSIFPSKLAKTSTGEYDYAAGDEYDAFASQQKLTLLSNVETNGYFPCGIVDSNVKSTLGIKTNEYICKSPLYPVVWVNGSRNQNWVIDKYPSEAWGYWTEKPGNNTFYKGFWFLPSIQFPKDGGSFLFYTGDVVYKTSDATVPTNPLRQALDGMVYNSEEGVYFLDAANLLQWNSYTVQSITSITASTYTGGGSWRLNEPLFRNVIDGSDSSCIWIKKSLVTLDETTVSIASVGFGRNPTDLGFSGNASPNGWVDWLRTGAGVFDYSEYDNQSSVFIISLILTSPSLISRIYISGFTRGYFTLRFYDENGSKIGEPFGTWVYGGGQYINIPLTNNVKTIMMTQTPDHRDSNWRNRISGKFTVYGYANINNILADFYYHTSYTPPSPSEILKLHDGSIATQLQTVFNSPPLKGLRYLVLKLNVLTDIDAIDITGGFYVPNPRDSNRKYSTKVRYSLEYNTDGGTTYYPICSEATDFDLSSGQTKSFEKSQLGEGFQALRIAIVINDIDVLTGFGADKWVISLVEFAAYQDTILTCEAQLTSTASPTDTDTIAYIYDTGDLLTTLKDKLYKKTEISKYLNTKTKLRDMAKLYLSEFLKNITRANVNNILRPDISLGDSINIIDPVDNSETIYFVEGYSSQSGGQMSVKLAKYE